ncbi:uncharacterized protein LOC123207830 isoform X2 [Mangifera indica]|uniref:uncharacterized protein LOC123207830 isoform X2 n=1 Tax=Mangifera indica TaxID=29780 RepID=UPI001CF9A38E|nr:uncharacterized protein LOC123207830 isoform X2 [Mangifera indica]
MDAVELEYPVDVPKFIGSDGFGRASVTVNEVVACESNTRGVSIIAKSSIERCSTFLRQKEKSQIVKQKSNVNGKRSDKRNFKNSMKGNYDSLFVKAGLVSFCSAAGGNSFFGMRLM